MHLQIHHQTDYSYDRPVAFGLQQLRLTPHDDPGQRVLSWEVVLEGAERQAEYDDEHGNRVILAAIDPQTHRVRITCRGEAVTEDRAGILGAHGELRGAGAPLWLYRRPTALTRPGAGVRALVRALGTGHETEIARIHALSALILERVAYVIGETDATTTAEDAISAGRGVCQDHAHVFLAACRAMGLPARYVSGYLATDEEHPGEAAHAWAEAHLEGLGWVGFDISNGISPDRRYLRVAVGLDYRDAAPVSGLRFGDGHETLDVQLSVSAQ